MICPLCHCQMIKVRDARNASQPAQIRCIQCRFAIFYRGLRAS